jgi:hypothetical protein
VECENRNQRIEAVLSWANARGYRDIANPATWEMIAPAGFAKPDECGRSSTSRHCPSPSLARSHRSFWREIQDVGQRRDRIRV